MDWSYITIRISIDNNISQWIDHISLSEYPLITIYHNGLIIYYYILLSDSWAPVLELLSLPMVFAGTRNTPSPNLALHWIFYWLSKVMELPQVIIQVTHRIRMYAIYGTIYHQKNTPVMWSHQSTIHTDPSWVMDHHDDERSDFSHSHVPMVTGIPWIDLLGPRHHTTRCPTHPPRWGHRCPRPSVAALWSRSSSRSRRGLEPKGWNMMKFTGMDQIIPLFPTKHQWVEIL